MDEPRQVLNMPTAEDARLEQLRRRAICLHVGLLLERHGLDLVDVGDSAVIVAAPSVLVTITVEQIDALFDRCREMASVDGGMTVAQVLSAEVLLIADLVREVGVAANHVVGDRS